jgi:hypothetical protein
VNNPRALRGKISNYLTLFLNLRVIMYHATTSAVSRGAGHSSCAKSAYIGGDEITNEITGEIHSYKNRHGVEHSEIILPSGIEKEITPQELWNKAENAEVRKDARVGREWTIALPHELDQEQRKILAQNLAQDIADRYQVGTQIAIHAPSQTGDQRNYHVHILTTTRKIDQDLNLTNKSDIELDRKQCAKIGIQTSQDQIIECRERIANRINQSLELANIQKQVSHLSYKDQGIDKIPTKHLGKSATFLERKGIKTEIGDYNRSAMRFNELKTTLESIYTHKAIESPNHTNINAPEALKTGLEIELTATERAKMYLQKLSEEKNKPENIKETEQKPITEDRKAQLLSDILSKRSYDQIIDRQKKERENKLEQEQAQKQEYQKTLKMGRGGFER